MTYALGAQKSTLLRASYARFADQLGTGNVGFDNPVGYTYMTIPSPTRTTTVSRIRASSARSTSTPGSTRAIRTVWSRRTRSHSNLKNTKTDEFMVGVDHQILPELVAGVTYTHRHRSDYIDTQATSA